MAMCNPNRATLGTVAGRKVLAEFSGGHVTSDAGVLLLSQAEAKSRLLERAAALIPDPRNPLKVEHTQEATLRQRVFALALGYEDVIDHDELCKDIAFQTAAGRVGKLAGASTVARLEHRADKTSMWALHKLLLDAFFESHTIAPEEIVLDLDSTDFRVHGGQEGRHFNAFYDENIFLPLYIFCGRHLLVSYLRPGRSDNMKHVRAIMRLLIAEIKKRWPKTKVVVRGDSGFYRHDFLTWMERNRIAYLIGFAKNPALNKYARHVAEESRIRHEKSGKKERVVDSMFYHAKSWTLPDRKKRKNGRKRIVRKVVVRAETGALGTDLRYVVTNIKGNSRDIYEAYCGRGEMENRIKDTKCHLFACRTSSVHWLTNQFRVMLASLAYTLLEFLRRDALQDTELATAEVATLRVRLLKIGAVVIRNTRRILFKMAEGYPFKDLYYAALARLQPS